MAKGVCTCALARVSECVSMCVLRVCVYVGMCESAYVCVKACVTACVRASAYTNVRASPYMRASP